MKTVFIRFGVLVSWAILATSLLTACGGGSGTGTNGPTSDANGPNIHADVPSNGAAKVTAISTPAGVVQRDQPPAVPTQVGASGYLVLATDANKDLFLAAFADPASGGVPMLTVESTAEALALIGQGRLPAGVTRAAFVQAVKNTPGYAGLLSTIRAALDRGVPPADHPEFWQSMALVLSQAIPAPSASASSSRVKAQNLARPTTSLPLPSVVIDGTVGDLAIVAAAPSVNGVRVSNGLPTHFAARGETIDTGADIGSLPSRFGQTQVSVGARNLDSIDFTSEEDVPGNGEVWNLHVFKSQDAKWRDRVSIAEDIFDVLAGGLFSKSCLEAAAEAMITANWASWGLIGSHEEIHRAMMGSFSQRATWETIQSVLIGCGSALMSQDQVETVARFLGRIPFRLPLLLIDATNIVTKTVYSRLYWDLDTRIGICQARNEATQELEIISCMATLLPGIQELNMQVGETQTYVLSPYTESGQLTEIPPNARMEYSSSRPEQLSIDPVTGVMTALAPTGDSEPPVQITATTRTYNLSATMSIRVVAAPPVNATLTVSMPEVTLGQSVQLAWSSSNASACTGSGDWSGPASVAGTTTFTASATGTFTFRLICTGNGQTAAVQATLRVLPVVNGNDDSSQPLVVMENGVRTLFTWQINQNVVVGIDSNGNSNTTCIDRLNAPSPGEFCDVVLSYEGPQTASFRTVTNQPFTPSLSIVLGFATNTFTAGVTYTGSDRVPPGFPESIWAGQAFGTAICSSNPSRVALNDNISLCPSFQSFGIRVDQGNRRVYFSGTRLEGTYILDASGTTSLPVSFILNGWVPY